MANQWKAECGCYLYPFFCTSCAAADVSEHLQKGSWGSYFCCVVATNFIPYAGYCINVCKILGTRKELVARDNIKDDAIDFCSMCCCLPCYLGQELAHIEASKNPMSSASGASK